MRTIGSLLVLVLSLAAAACGGEATAPAGSSAKPASSGAPAAKGSAAAKPGDTAKPAETAKPAAGALVDLDLSPAGDAFKGMKAKGPEGSVVASDGAGGAQIATKEAWQVSVGTDPKLIKDIKDGAQFGAKAGDGKITFSTDTAEAIDYVMEIKDPEGKVVKAWGFAQTIDVGGKKHLCSAAGLMEEAHLAKAKDLCKSISK